MLILTTFDPDEYAYKALRAGASGFLLKDVPPDQLAIAVRTVDAAVAGRLERLTDREREVVVAARLARRGHGHAGPAGPRASRSAYSR